MQNLFNIKGLHAAKGGALCKGKHADSEQILHNPEGRARFWCFLLESGTKGGWPLDPGFQQESLKIWPVKPLSEFRDTL